MDILSDINAWFWNEYFWLPSNITWNDVGDTSTVDYAQYSDLHNAFKVALALLVVRYVLEQYVFSPIGQYLGLKPKVIRKVNNDTNENKVLEKAFHEKGRLDQKQVQGLAKQLDWSERRVERWIRRRISRGKPTTLKKFTETAWRFTFYLCAFCYGLYTLWDKPWFWSTNYCWYDYPHHSVTDDIWWYYMLELGFYWSLAITQFVDTKRKDFLQLFVHHIVTIILLTISWASNLFRIGSLVLIIHDVADVPLEAAKMAKYVENQRVAEACFAVFTVVWFVSRLVIYPFRLIYSTMYEAYLFLPIFPAYYMLRSLLCALQVMHIIWTWAIVKVALLAISSKNTGVGDLRSDSEEIISSDSENDGAKNK